jgi:hypothetical protein
MKSACRKKIGELTVYFKTNPRARLRANRCPTPAQGRTDLR